MIFRISECDYKIDREQLKKVAKAAFSVLGNKKGEIELNLVDQAEICRLNSVYRNIDEVTDVLSFTLEQEPLTGQIFICYTEAESRSRKHNAGLLDELSKLVIHGICHVYGLDHENVDEEAIMNEQEDKIREKIK